MRTRLFKLLTLSVLVSKGVLAQSDEAAAAAAAPSEPIDSGFRFRLGGLVLHPLGTSGEVQLANVTGPARLALHDGPIAGSSVGLGTNVMAAAIVGYALPFLNRQLSIETVLAAPFTMKMVARGTLANQSLAPSVLGNVSTGAPALGSELGEVTTAPPMLTLVYRFLAPSTRVNPYFGVGVNYLIPLSARITNPVLTEVTTPTLEVGPKLGWVLQAGADVHLYKWFYATADLKYVGGLTLTATVKDIYVKMPDLPLFGSAKIGDNVATLTIDPIVVFVGVGMNL